MRRSFALESGSACASEESFQPIAATLFEKDGTTALLSKVHPGESDRHELIYIPLYKKGE